MPNADVLVEDREKLINELISEIINKRIYPEDHYEITALLESMGWNDRRAVENFGVKDLFELSTELWNIIQKKISSTRITPIEKIDFKDDFIETMRSFLRGAIFAIPMGISVLAMLTLRFSLWSYEYLSLELATSIAIGTILSFMTVGGFTQAIARRGFSYIRQGYYTVARQLTFYFVKLGYIVCFITTGILLVANIFFSVFPTRMLIVIALYYIFLTAIWLSVTIMYILEREITFTGLLIAGIILVYIFFRVLNLNIIISQIIALFIISISGLVIVIYLFSEEERKLEKGIAPVMPRMSIVIYSILPYFTYGFLYFTFLFTDRVIAWSTNDTYMPYFIWFRGAYELGLDFALLTLIIPMGFNEVIVTKLMFDLDENLKSHSLYKTIEMNRKYLNTYIKRFVSAFLVSVISAFFIYWAVSFIDQMNLPQLRTGFLRDYTTRFVFIWALAAYSILSIALMNAVTLFSLSQPERVSHSVFYALIVNILVGFILSRWIYYSFAVFGLLSGSLVFVVQTSYHLVKVFKNLDYYLYAAS